jgi:exodeoxyribonuclease VII large subunit
VRASTPTAAARLLVPDLDELLAGLERARERLGAGLGRLLERRREQLARTGERLQAAPRLVVERRRAALAEAGGRLRTLSPQATLDRGYAIVRTGGIVLRSAADAAAGDEIDVRLARSSLAATVTAVREDAP